MDRIEERFAGIKWRYAGGDPHALAELEDRIADVARNRQLITYSDVARGVPFDLPNLKESPRTIDVTEWQELDRAIIGDFLGYISMRSYGLGRFFSSALVVSKMDGSPGQGFYDLLKQLELIPNLQSARALDLWAEHVAKSHTWYASH